MFFQITLYIHILAATAWIGGALLLFALGVVLRDKKAQEQVYLYIGPIYGYFETIWLIILWVTGIILFIHYDMYNIMMHGDSQLAYAMDHKLRYVALITVLTIVHMYIALKTHTKNRTKLQHIISRASSLLIFFANLGILWFAVLVREILT